jgi:zinc transporter, ZIP family
MTVHSENVGPAFGLVIAAGASTALGAAVVFFPSLVTLANRDVLGSSLSFSAGVMVYVSFAEIFIKSFKSFEKAGWDSDRAYVYASVCFFFGILVVMVRIWIGSRSTDKRDVCRCSDTHFFFISC